MKAKYLKSPLHERLKPEITLRKIADILMKEKKDRRSSVKGGNK
jgi:hypothetical protein